MTDEELSKILDGQISEIRDVARKMRALLSDYTVLQSLMTTGYVIGELLAQAPDDKQQKVAYDMLKGFIDISFTHYKHTAGENNVDR